MKIFAKIFEINGYQILAIVDSAEEDDGYEVRLTFAPTSDIVGLCTIKLLFTEEEQAEKAFNHLDESKAYSLVHESITKIESISEE